MGIFIVLVVIVLAGFLISNVSFDAEWETLGDLLQFIGAFLLIIAVLILPIERYKYKAELAEFNSVKSSVEVLRTSGSSKEKIAIGLKIISANEWLAQAQYWQKNKFVSVYIPREVADAKPIK